MQIDMLEGLSPKDRGRLRLLTMESAAANWK